MSRSERGRSRNFSPDKPLDFRPATASRLWSLFLFAILPGLALGETSDAPAQRPQFRNSQPPPVLDENTHRSIGGGYTGTEGLTNIPPGAFQPDRVGVSQATLFRNTTFPYGNIIAPSAVGPTVRSENASAGFKLSLPTLSGGLRARDMS